jgi:hypothetical protein
VNEIAVLTETVAVCSKISMCLAPHSKDTVSTDLGGRNHQSQTGDFRAFGQIFATFLWHIQSHLDYQSHGRSLVITKCSFSRRLSVNKILPADAEYARVRGMIQILIQLAALQLLQALLIPALHLVYCTLSFLSSWCWLFVLDMNHAFALNALHALPPVLIIILGCNQEGQ